MENKFDMFYDDEARGSNIHESATGGEEIPLSKGLWTSEEDEILAEHVTENGEGRWREVGKILARTGQSCRHRWMNHLRSDLKKGPFTEVEELKIAKLQAVMGNKWSKIAEQLPGRNGYDIQNYWNWRKRRCERFGLPLYPPEICTNVANHVSQSQDFEAGESSSMFELYPPEKCTNVANHVSQSHDFEAGESSSSMFEQGLDSVSDLAPEFKKLLTPQYYQFQYDILMRHKAPSSSGNASLSAGGMNNFELPSLQSTTGNFNVPPAHDTSTSEGSMFQQCFDSASQSPLLFPDSDIFYNGSAPPPTQSIDQNACSSGNAPIPNSLPSPLPSFDELFDPFIQSPPTQHQAQSEAVMQGKGKLYPDETCTISHQRQSQEHNFDVAADIRNLNVPAAAAAPNTLPRLPDIDHIWGTAPPTQIRQDQLHDVNLYNNSNHAPSSGNASISIEPSPLSPSFDDHDMLDAWIQSQLFEVVSSSSPRNDGYLELDPPQTNLEASNLAKEDNEASTSHVNYDDDDVLGST